MSRILLMINPKSRSGEKATQEITEALRTCGHSIIIPEDKESRDDPNEFIRKNKTQADFVIVGGGDGSVNHLLPGLVDTQLPLVVYPLGTANNLARTYNIPFDAKGICDLLKEGQVIYIDLGEVNNNLFVNVAGLGLSTEINRHVPHTMKRHLGVLAFILTAFKMFFKMNPFRAWIDGGKGEIKTRSWQISVCNGKHYGSGLTIKHDASLDDGKLHLLSTEVKNFWEGIKLIPTLYSGHYKRHHEVTLLTSDHFHIRTKRTLKIDVDGDLKTQTPAEFKVHINALKILVAKPEIKTE
ncbi:MAG: lipid kinase [Bdellovibrionales bacterium]|nr:lipid kinase [Bdellovibrionales bacterium]